MDIDKVISELFREFRNVNTYFRKKVSRLSKIRVFLVQVMSMRFRILLNVENLLLLNLWNPQKPNIFNERSPDPITNSVPEVLQLSVIEHQTT